MRIGTVEINSQLALAPMAGVTDAAFRELCASLGAGLTCTELVSSKALCYQDKKSRTLLAPFPGEHPMQAQIFGSDPVCMAEAAQIAIEASGADILDINMGCPVGKVVNNGDGSALMRDPEKAARIAEAVVRAVKVPVTVKMRRGWDKGSINAPELAVLLESVGVAAITVHGCRAALAGEPIPPLPPLAERCDALVRQIERSAEFRNEKVALLEARRHYCWYLKGVKYANYYKDQINHMETLEDLYRVTAGIKRDLSD